MLENITLLEIVGSVLGAVLTFFFAWLARKMKANEAEKEAIEALNVGVNQTYQLYVRELKKSKVDGKLSKEEGAHARGVALSEAKKIATGPALKLLTKWGAPRLMALVQDLVNKKKKS